MRISRWLKNKKQEADESQGRPSLPELIFAAGCTRIAVVGLHPGAGARTTLEGLAAELHRRGIPAGVTRAPRLPLETPEVDKLATRIELPERTVVATTDSLADGLDRLEPIERLNCRTVLGEIGLYRVTRGGVVPVYGPDDPGSMRGVLERLETYSDGLALVDGAWERRAFAAPAAAQAVVLAVGAGYSGSHRRSAAALGYAVEVLAFPECEGPASRAWRETATDGKPRVLDVRGRQRGVLSSGECDPTSHLKSIGDDLATVVLPDGLHDAFLGPLSRSAIRATLVVKDATRIHAAPLYLKAWLKRAGAIQVVEPVNLIAVATNPFTASGPDADPDEFRRVVREAVPGIPVHDVQLELDSALQPSRRS